MGVTATGLCLLRTVDPDCQTDAQRVRSLQSNCLHEPFMPGGIMGGYRYSTFV